MKPLKTFETRHHSQIDEIFHQLNLNNIGNVLYWLEFFRITKNVEGDIVECGIGRGRSLLILAALNFLLDKSEGGGRKIYGYDSFAGFPEPSLQDQSPRNPQKGEWSRSPSGKYEYSPEFILNVLKEGDIKDYSSVQLTRGFFSETLPHHPQRPIAILNVDGDLYQSYKDTLEALYDRVSPGGVIVFDDFLAAEAAKEAFPGARRAVSEFFHDRLDQIKTSIGGTCYFQKR